MPAREAGDVVTARWVRKDYPTIMSGLVVRYFWRDRVVSSDEPEINASRDGVSIQGRWPTMTEIELDELNDVLRAAYFQFVSIRDTGHARDDKYEKDDRKGVFG